jgi:membrane fusion protein (multidrug efflux system)
VFGFPPTPRSFRARTARALALGVCALGVACTDAESDAEQRGGQHPPTVEAVIVEPEHVRDVVEFVGQLDATYSVVLKPEVSGVIDSILFEEGAPVTAGDPLFRLRDAEQRARLREARAEVALARDVVDRTRALAKRKAESAAELNRAEAQYEIALARVELAQVELDRTVVRAPFDGVVGERLVSPGERVSPGGDRGPGGGGESTGLARIDSLDPLDLVFTIPEAIIAIVTNGVRVTLRVAPFPGEFFRGQVYFVAPRVNVANRRMLVKARIPNPEHKLRPGLFAKLDVVVAEREGALMLPEDAVVYAREGTFVWRLDRDDLAERLPIEIGIRQVGRVEIRKGIRPGDRIVASGTHKVVSGKAVRSVTRGAAPAEEIGL